MRKFDVTEPSAYRVAYETPQGEFKESEAVAYLDTHAERDNLADGGNHVIGIVRSGQ